jgi:hypothetical protein
MEAAADARGGRVTGITPGAEVRPPRPSPVPDLALSLPLRLPSPCDADDRSPFILPETNPPVVALSHQCPLTGFPLDYSYKDARRFSTLLEDPPFAGVAKGMDRAALPRGSTLNACGVRLNNNRLESLEGLEAFLDAVLDDPSELRWLDLSHNRLTTIDPVLLKYPKLTCLYLHGNRIERLLEVRKLAGLDALGKLTLNANPAEASKDYRAFVVAYLKRLRSLDTIAITPDDRKRVEFWDRARRQARGR